MLRCPVCGGPTLRSGNIESSDKGSIQCKHYPSHYKFEWAYMNSLITVRDSVFCTDRVFYNRRKSADDAHDPLPENVKMLTDRISIRYGYRSEEDADD